MDLIYDFTYGQDQIGLGVDGESSHFHVSGKKKKKKNLYGKDEMKSVLWEQRMNVSRNGVRKNGALLSCKTVIKVRASLE